MDAEARTRRPARSPLVQRARTFALILGAMVGVMWLAEAIDQVFFDGGLDGYGIEPRTMNGLRGILLAPFLHGGFSHLTGNTVPLVVLGFVVMVRSKRHLLFVSVSSALMGGFGTWVVGAPNTLHFGASGLVFGYIGYVVVRGMFERRFWPVLLAAVVLLVYGGLLWGMFPGDPTVSWEAHLFGFIGGALAARLIPIPRLRIAPARKPTGDAGARGPHALAVTQVARS